MHLVQTCTKCFRWKATRDTCFHCLGFNFCTILYYMPTRAQQYLRWATVATIHMGRKERDCCAPFAGGAGSPSNTKWPGLMSLHVVSEGLYKRGSACADSPEKFCKIINCKIDKQLRLQARRICQNTTPNSDCLHGAH